MSRAGAALGAAAFAVGLSLSGGAIASASPADSGAADTSAPDSGSARAAARSAAPHGAVRERTRNSSPARSADRQSGPAPAAAVATPVAARKTAVPATALPATSVETPTAASPIEQAAAVVTSDVPQAPAARAASLIPRIYRAAAAVPAPAAATAMLSTTAPLPAASAVAGGNASTGSANRIGDFVSGFMLMFRNAFLNKAPTASPKQAMVRPSGQVWGFMEGADPEGDPITYTVKQAPKYGTVSIDPNGVYTYVPSAGFTGTDTFTVKVTDSVFHFLSGKKAVKVSVNSSLTDPAGTVVDNFNGAANSAPNPSLWTTTTGMFIDSGIQTYSNSTDNVRLDGQGHLVLQGMPTPDGYTSGEVLTRGKVDMTYGAMTARIKFPAGQGIWPAFWMLGSTYSHDTWNSLGPTGWPGAGEIDVMELVNNGTTYHVALHGPQISDGKDYYTSAGNGQFVGATGPISDLTTDYHDYWVMRAPDLIVVGVDDQKLATFTPDSLPADGQWVFNQPMYATLNVAIGGSWPGLPDATTPWPATMLVDSFKYTPLA